MSEESQNPLDDRAMTWRQRIVVALMIGLNALDGFDVLSSAFAAPGIAAEWDIDRAALGVVLSMELVGMGFGAILLGGLADKIGRKGTVMLCLITMAISMGMATTSQSTFELSVWRLLTGLGIGGMLAAINAVTAEVSNRSGRSVAMALMVIGYPVGATIGGAASAVLLQNNDWRIVFELGAVLTAAFIPLIWFIVPETPAFHAGSARADALDKVNVSLVRLGQAPVAALPPVPETEQTATGPGALFAPGLRRITILMSFAYSFHFFTFYYVLKWAPKIVADTGYSQAEAASVLVWANIGGAIGGGLFGFVMKKMGIRIPTAIMLAVSFVTIAAFGLGHADLAGWSIAVFISGLATNSAVVGLYTLLAQGFPSRVRAFGTGFAVGVGRIGAAGSPIIAGLLFSGVGLDLLATSIVMGLGSLLAAGMIMALPKHVTI